MRKTALSSRILLGIDKPARYLGNEINAIYKDPKKTDIRFAMCFPDVYEIGMSHLGIQILYEMFNRREDTWCERVYSPWVDLDKVMREEKIPLFALESQDPVKDFDFLGITIQYEMCYTNILQILDLSGIPLHAKDRTDEDPIVIGGGPCTYNPAPIAEFFDMFYIGEGEVVYDDVLDLYKQMKTSGAGREAFLREAAKIPGIYVPSLYQVTYFDDGTIASFKPLYEDVPKVITKQLVMDMNQAPYPDKPLIPFIKVTQDRVALEIQRGCIRGCRFCQAGMIYRPVREKDVCVLEESARRMMEATGHEEMSLSSLSTSDYTHIRELITDLIDTYGKDHVNLSLPSLRIDSFSLDVMNKVQDVRKSSLTFAPEAGSQRLRDVINKGLTKEEILAGAGEAFSGGWDKVKLYFMLGLPTENDEDREDIANLANDIAALYYETVPREQRKGKCQITVSTSFFVPKPFTPFQWASMNTEEEFLAKARTVKEEVKIQQNQKSIRYTYHHAGISVLEGVLARGDRRVADVIETVYRNGARFDAWSEFFDLEKWQDAFAACGIDPYFYTKRERDVSELLPWDFIHCGVTKTFLVREWERAKAGVTTPNCRDACSGCGCAYAAGKRKDLPGGLRNPGL